MHVIGVGIHARIAAAVMPGRFSVGAIQALGVDDDEFLAVGKIHPEFVRCLAAAFAGHVFNVNAAAVQFEHQWMSDAFQTFRDINGISSRRAIHHDVFGEEPNPLGLRVV